MIQLLHRFAAIPKVYDAIQFAVGLPYSRQCSSNPQTSETLETMLAQHFTIQKLEYFAVYHRYLLATCTK